MSPLWLFVLIVCYRPLRKYEIRKEREKVHISRYRGWFHVHTLWYLLLDCFSVDIIFYFKQFTKQIGNSFRFNNSDSQTNLVSGIRESCKWKRVLWRILFFLQEFFIRKNHFSENRSYDAHSFNIYYFSFKSLLKRIILLKQV